MWHAVCELCRNSMFSPEGLVAFTVKNREIVHVTLGGKEPWSGVRVVCDSCLGKLVPMASARLASLEADRARLIEAWPVYREGGEDVDGVLYERAGFWWAEMAIGAGHKTREAAIRQYVSVAARKVDAGQ